MATGNNKDSKGIRHIGLHQTGLRSTPMLDEETPFKTMMASFDEAARRIGLQDQQYKLLRKPDREIAVVVPVKMDDGSLRLLDGYRIQHNCLLYTSDAADE